MPLKILLPALLGCLSAVAAVAQGEPSISQIPSEDRKNTPGLNPDYLLYAPVAKQTGKVPLVIYLHGAGGVGDDMNKIKSQPAPIWNGIQEFTGTPCYLVAPQCMTKVNAGPRGGWQVDELNAFLEHLKATLPIDDKRIYLTGNSMGGYGAWMWGGTAPEHFAAVAPLVGGLGPGGPKDVTDRLDEWAANLATIPVYAFVGGKDNVVPPDRSERMVAAIRAAGGKQVKFKNYPEEGHNVRRIIYTTAEFYDWLFSHQRD